jgi:metal-responsive CopG/Arc/MetJ family transcriptional regulator
VRDEQIAFYVSEKMKRELDRLADAEGVSRSEYVYRLVADALERDAADDFAAEIDAEARIRELIEIATDEMTQATAEMREMNAKAGAYAAANFELLKQDHPDARRRDALRTGARRLRQDLDVVADDLGGSAEDDAESPESDGGDDSSLVEELRGDDE